MQSSFKLSVQFKDFNLLLKGTDLFFPLSVRFCYVPVFILLSSTKLHKIWHPESRASTMIVKILRTNWFSITTTHLTEHHSLRLYSFLSIFSSPWIWNLNFQILFEELIRSGFVMYYWTTRQPENGKWLMTCLIKYQNFISLNCSTRKFIWFGQQKKCTPKFIYGQFHKTGPSWTNFSYLKRI